MALSGIYYYNCYSDKSLSVTIEAGRRAIRKIQSIFLHPLSHKPTEMHSIWHFQAIVDYSRADNEIAAALTVEDLNDLTNPNSSWLIVLKYQDSLGGALEYQGFDPIVIIKAMLAAKKSYDDSRRELVQWDLSNMNGGLAASAGTTAGNKYSNQECFVKDVQFLVTVYLTRNNHFSKINKKSRAGISDILATLQTKYGIDDEVHESGTPLSSIAITLPRITGCFPTVACPMFHEGIGKLAFGSLPHTSGSRELSRAVVCSLLPSCTPKELVKKVGGNIHPLMVYVAVNNDCSV